MDESQIKFQMAVVVPLCQALITAVLVSVLLLVLAMLANHYTAFQVSPWLVGVVGFCLSGLYTWMSLFSDWRRSNYGDVLTVETIQDQEPVTVRHEPVRVELASDNGRSMQLVDLPATTTQLQELGAGLTQGVSFTESAWVGSGKPFSRSEFISLRDALIARGLAAWNSPRDTARGVSLTRPGRAVMRHFASETPTLLSRR